MKNDKLPRLLEEGIKCIAEIGCQSVYEDLIEEYAKKLKRDFTTRMSLDLMKHVSVISEKALESNDYNVNIEVTVKRMD